MTRATSRTPTGSGSGRPDAEPLASETIPEIVALIEALIEGGHAYESGGDVYFRVRSFTTTASSPTAIPRRWTRARRRARPS